MTTARARPPTTHRPLLPEHRRDHEDRRDHLHDVRHQVATVMMLAAALDVRVGADDATRRSPAT